MQQELNAQSRELHTMSTAMVNLQSQVLDLERYTRGYNIRIFGVNESQGDVCKEKVDRILADKFAVESAIENAHRTGKAESGRPRPIIARFYSRFTRRAVMRVAKEKLHNTNIRFVDDLTKMDLEEKNRLKPFMAELYHKIWILLIYHRVYFDCIKIINLRGYIDLLDTSVIVFVNNLLWFVFHFMLFA